MCRFADADYVHVGMLSGWFQFAWACLQAGGAQKSISCTHERQEHYSLRPVLQVTPADQHSLPVISLRCVTVLGPYTLLSPTRQQL